MGLYSPGQVSHGPWMRPRRRYCELPVKWCSKQACLHLDPATVLQLGAVLLGGKVGASPNGMEIGLAQDINLTPSGEHHPMMAGRSHGFCVPCMHRDEVQALPDAATLIAYNSHCPIQAIGYQANGVDFWGVQYHPEFPAGYVAGIVQDQVGIFSEVGNQANDLRIADTDPDAASRLGGNQKDLVEGIRVTELTNWLSHIKKVNL